MAEELLAKMPERFTLIGLSLGGYLAFEIIRQQLQRLERLVLMDTTAASDHPARRAGRLADIAKVRDGGIEALIPELPARWLHPAHAQRAELTNLVSAMARSIGARGQFNQQTAMLSRPDSQADLERVRVPTLLVCGREDPVTPVPDHEAMAARVRGAQLEIIENCGHLSTIEQPEVVTRVVRNWLEQTKAATPRGRRALSCLAFHGIWRRNWSALIDQLQPWWPGVTIATERTVFTMKMPGPSSLYFGGPGDTMTATAIRFISLLLTSLLVGTMFGVWLGFDPAALSATAYAEMQQNAIRSLNVSLPILGFVCILLTAALAVLSREDKRARLLSSLRSHYWLSPA